MGHRHTSHLTLKVTVASNGLRVVSNFHEAKKNSPVLSLLTIVVAMDSSNGNTPMSEDMNKPPEGLVRPPKDIQGDS